MGCKKSVRKNCPIVTRKTPVLESLFNRVAGRQAFMCFLVNIENFLRTNILKDLRTAASEGSFYVKKSYHFLSKFKQSERKISMSVFTVFFTFSRSYQ